MVMGLTGTGRLVITRPSAGGSEVHLSASPPSSPCNQVPHALGVTGSTSGKHRGKCGLIPRPS